jgi:hypothetical protein
MNGGKSFAQLELHKLFSGKYKITFDFEASSDQYFARYFKPKTFKDHWDSWNNRRTTLNKFNNEIDLTCG